MTKFREGVKEVSFREGIQGRFNLVIKVAEGRMEYLENHKFQRKGGEVRKTKVMEFDFPKYLKK